MSENVSLKPIAYSAVQVGKFYFRTPDCVVLFVVENRENDKLAVLVGRILNGKERDADSFDLKRIQPEDGQQLYEFESFPKFDEFKKKLKESGHYYEKAIGTIDSASCSKSPFELAKEYVLQHKDHLRRSMNYLSIGRKLVQTTIDEACDLKFYPDDRPFYTTNHLQGWQKSTKGFGFPVSAHTGIQHARKTIELPSSVIQSKRFFLLDRVVANIGSEFQDQETSLVIDALMSVSNLHGMSIKQENLHPAGLRKGFEVLEKMGITVTQMVVNPIELSTILSWGKDVMDEATTRERLTSNLSGHLWTADVYSTNCMPAGRILLSAQPHDAGEMIVVNSFISLGDSDDIVTYDCQESFSVGVYGERSVVLTIE